MFPHALGAESGLGLDELLCQIISPLPVCWVLGKLVARLALLCVSHVKCIWPIKGTPCRARPSKCDDPAVLEVAEQPKEEKDEEEVEKTREASRRGEQHKKVRKPKGWGVACKSRFLFE